MSKMVKIESNEKEIIGKLKNGEVVFASIGPVSFEDGSGVILLDGELMFCNRDRTPKEKLSNYFRSGHTFYVEYNEKKKEEVVFELGDKVIAFGLIGEVIENNEGSHFPIDVLFENDQNHTFTKDGRLYDWHQEPSLKILEKSKKKKTAKKFYEFVYRTNNNYPWTLHKTLVCDNFEDSTGKKVCQGMERKLLTEWSIEL